MCVALCFILDVFLTRALQQGRFLTVILAWFTVELNQTSQTAPNKHSCALSDEDFKDIPG